MSDDRPRVVQLLGEKLEEAAAMRRMREDATRALLRADGPAAAAWLVFSQRARFHRSGAVDFYLPRVARGRYAPMPMWFWVAVVMLRARTEKWEVVETKEPSRRSFRVRWLLWGGCARAGA